MSFLNLIAPTSKDLEKDKQVKLEWVGFSKAPPEDSFEEEKKKMFKISLENTPTVIKRPYSDHGFKLSYDGKRRKFSTKDCEECTICSDEVFEVNIIFLKKIFMKFSIHIFFPGKPSTH